MALGKELDHYPSAEAYFGQEIHLKVNSRQSLGVLCFSPARLEESEHRRHLELLPGGTMAGHFLYYLRISKTEPFAN
jgi:hypothetical protein